jgi:uncharacterized repeat protein (TIGR01451 family)
MSAGGILPGVAYEIRIAAADPVLVGKNPTLANAGSDIHDSDGVVSGANIVAAASIPVLGANDHTFDFGFTDTPIITEVDLQISKRASPTCVEPGSRITFTVTVKNIGPLGATGVVVTDDLPIGLLLDSVTPSQGTCNNLDPMTCNLGSLASGAEATITIVETVPNNPSVASYTNVAVVTSNEPDSNPTTTTLRPRRACSFLETRIRSLDLVTRGRRGRSAIKRRARYCSTTTTPRVLRLRTCRTRGST